MADKSAVPLPIATTEYDEINETITRRTIEQTFQDINSDIGNAKRKQDKKLKVKQNRKYYARYASCLQYQCWCLIWEYMDCIIPYNPKFIYPRI